MSKKILILIVILLLSFVAIVGGMIAFDVIDINRILGREGSPSTIVEEHQLAISGNIITNIKNSKNYVKCELVFVITNHDEFLKLEKNEFKIKDLIIEILRATEEKDYYQDDIQSILSEKIITKISEDLNVSSISRIYFKQLITQ